ncbi:MAG: tetratricopeptide repeat protein [Bdellovibrionaceae bacterium]|nr:tetratricopeptide repeat protein [Pseudobdellovibrionaceae bacterium]
MKILILSVFIFFTGCTHNLKTKEPKTAKFYFEKASQYKEKGNNAKALEKLTKIRQEFFSSSYNGQALLMMADIYFDQKKYKQASLTYTKYIKFYSDKKDYVLYQLGLSYKNQLPNRSEHDLSLTASALSAFNQLLALKEKSLYKKKAIKMRQEVLDKKAERELKIALFFKKQGWSQASFKRIQYFIKHYPKSPLMPKALLKAFELAKTLNKDSNQFKARLLKEYPQSPFAKLLNKDPSFLSVIKEKIL